MFGVIAAYAAARWPARWNAVARPAVIAGLALLASGLGARVWLSESSAVTRILYYDVVALGSAMLLPGLSAWRIGPGAGRVAGFVTRMSLYSYSMYLVNVPLAKILTRILPISADPVRVAVLATIWIVATYVIAGLCYRHFESRMTNLRDVDLLGSLLRLRPAGLTARCVPHRRLRVRSERASGGRRPGSPRRGHRSLEVAEVGQALLDDLPALRRCTRTACDEGRRASLRADRGGSGGRAGVGRRAGRADDRLAFDVGRDGEAEQGEDRGRGVDQIGLEMAAGGEARAGEGDDSLGPVGAGEIGVGLDPGAAGRQLGADPVGLVGQGDQVGISLAGRIDLVGLGGLDDLREEGRAGLGVPGLGERLRRRPCGPRRSAAGSSCGAAVFTPPCRAAQLT